jgi:outer membrane lipoprotein-sorting protein
MHRTILALFIFSLSLVSLAQSTFKPMKDTTAFKVKVDKMAEQTKSIQSDFLQVKKLEALSDEISSKGQFSFQKPGSLRWQYNTPYKYVIVINKEKMLIKDEDNTVKKYDINSNKVFREINDIMVSCVNGKILSNGKFAAKYFENEKSYKVELSPLDKNIKQSLKQINLYFDKEVKAVTKLEMLEPGKDLTTLDFTNQKLNEQVPAERFILK